MKWLQRLIDGEACSRPTENIKEAASIDGSVILGCSLLANKAALMLSRKNEH